MSSNAADVPGNASPSHADHGTGRQRSERLRARRDEAGMAQVSGWVPKERRPYAREVLAALARGSNSLPPDPEQRAALEAAQAAADVARAAEAVARAAVVEAEQRGQVLVVELDAARAKSEADREEATRDLMTLRAEAEAMQAREQAAQEATAALRGELDGIKGRRGWRGVLLRLAGVKSTHGPRR